MKMKKKKTVHQNRFFFVGDNIRPVNESVIMLRCIAVFCFCVNKMKEQSFFLETIQKNHIKPHLQYLQKSFHLGPY